MLTNKFIKFLTKIKIYQKYSSEPKWIWFKWINNHTHNYPNDLFSIDKFGLYLRNKTFSSTDFKFPKNLIFFILSLSFFPQIIFSIFFGLVRIIDPQLFDNLSEIFILASRIVINYIPFVWLVFTFFLCIFWYKSRFFQSGFYLFFLFFLFFKTTSVINLTLYIFNIENIEIWIIFWHKWNSWIQVIFYIFFLISALFIIPDVKQAFLLLFLNRNQTRKIISKIYFKKELLIDNLENIYQKKMSYNWLSYQNRKSQIETLITSVILIAVVTFVGGVLNFSGSIISNLFPNITFGNQNSINQSLKSDYYYSFLPTILLVSFLAPFIEELALRSALMKSNNNSWNSVILSGLIFGIMHVHNDNFFVIFSYLFFGLSQAFFYKLSGNIWIVFLSHAILNIFSLFVR